MLLQSIKLYYHGLCESYYPYSTAILIDVDLLLC